MLLGKWIIILKNEYIKNENRWIYFYMQIVVFEIGYFVLIISKR